MATQEQQDTRDELAEEIDGLREERMDLRQEVRRLTARIAKLEAAEQAAMERIDTLRQIIGSLADTLDTLDD